jgi:hypothetical protein
MPARTIVPDEGWSREEEAPMRIVLIVLFWLAGAWAAAAQGTITVTRPAGTSFSVTTGIGSSATLITHPPAPPPAFTTSVPIVGLFSYVPVPTEKKDEGRPSDEDRAKQPKPAPSAYQAANAIGRDRTDSPHDSAFRKDNYFRQQEEKARAGR